MNRKHLAITFCTILLCIFNSIVANKSNGTSEIKANVQDGSKSTNSSEILITAAMYTKIFKERRKEHHFVVKQMMKSSYEKKYKLLQLAYEKIFEIISEQNATLSTQSYVAKLGFPTEQKLQDAVVLAMENCCIAAESLLHFPEISYRIFKKFKFTNWKPIMNWCIEFVNEFVHIIDESTVTLLSLLQQEINEELREQNYYNPYYESKDILNGASSATKSKKLTKKLKKGPQLTGQHSEL